ncbi:MAG TPA: hypothetical protein VM260_06615 [Pirellula sp.]|nr:hypothetical protein [Pirellula sp.]
MQSNTKFVRRKTFATALLVGGPLLVCGRSILAESPIAKGNTKPVPSYVAAHFEKAKVRTVHANKAIVRCGPADKYYSTSTLLNGASVDVYMETSDGWSGIRPPVGSHDWIPANIAYLLPGGKSAEIIEDKSPAWVGGDSADVSAFMWQMELVKSQQVQVLGEELQLTDDGKNQLWYRIAPPQGEFRWVKTSLLSDSPRISSNDSGVQLANYAEESPSSLSSGKSTQPSGQVVWSDEKQALVQVEQQIQREQAEIQSKMAADGIHVKINSPTAAVQSRGNASKQVSSASEFIANEPETVVMDVEEPESAMLNSTVIRPIPRPNQKRTVGKSHSTEHQIDGQRQWEAMQSADPKLRVRPVSSLLGLIGLNVIEADRAPVNTRISQEFHTNSSQGNVGRIGPVGNSRLDRLPRPGQHASGVHGSSLTLPHEAYTTGSDRNGTNFAVPVPYNEPLNQRGTTISRWFNSREPVFGAPPNAMNNMGAMDSNTNVNPGAIGLGFAGSTTVIQNNPTSIGMGYPIANQTQASPLALDSSAWHGLSPSLQSPGLQSPIDSINSGSINGNILNPEKDPEEFQTPEIQSALVHLTRQVAGPTEEWNFSELRDQASSWVENGATAMVRGEARLLMERIERFESLRQRTLGLELDRTMIAQKSIGDAALAAIRHPNNVTPASATNAGLSGSIVSNAVGTSPIVEGDASGWLVQVHTSIKGQPEFALTDDAGKVITYVQSTASLNLRRYLQQPVRVYGVRGYIPNLAAKQILAERIVRMR